MNKKGKISKHILDEMRYHDNHFDLLTERGKKDLIWQVPEEMIFINKYLYKGRNWILLDVGCGSAMNIKRNIMPRMTEDDVYIGVDISKKLLGEAKKNIPSGIFIQQPMGNLEFPGQCFDYICFFGALHHDEEPGKTLKKIAKFLKPMGFLFLREPQDKAMKKGYGESPHEGGINPVDLKRWLRASNFEILEWHFLNTKLFHLSRQFFTKLKLSYWEQIEIFWKIKVRMELFLEKFLRGFLSSLEGTDMFIVARKIK